MHGGPGAEFFVGHVADGDDQVAVVADVAEQQRICRDMQVQAFQDVPYYPLGQLLQPTSYKKALTGVPFGFVLFWHVKQG